MQLYSLPNSTIINRVIPKKSFDKYTNTKQKKLFAELVDKIRWLNKLSLETINLQGKDIHEIQLFEVQLKKKADVIELLNIIDKAIPYPIIFVVRYKKQHRLFASYKHPHPSNEHISVIDWSFSSDWQDGKEDRFTINLNRSLDSVFADFCRQLSGNANERIPISKLIEKEQKTHALKRSIAEIKVKINKQKQFNKKVELNLELQKLHHDLDSLRNS